MIDERMITLNDEDSNNAVERFDHDKMLATRHSAMVHFEHALMFAPDSYRPIDDPKYRKPNLEEVSEVLGSLSKRHGKAAAARMLGAEHATQAARTLNRWMTGVYSIPYTTWRLALILDGRAMETNRIENTDGEKPWEKYFGE